MDKERGMGWDREGRGEGGGEGRDGRREGEERRRNGRKGMREGREGKGNLAPRSFLEVGAYMPRCQKDPQNRIL